MILPASYTVMMLVLFLGMFAWGTWANTLKAAGDKWRFELYCFDFAIGTLIAATVIALTFGNLGFDGFSFVDDLRLAGKRQELFAFGAGTIFNLGNMLLLAGVSLVGMGVAFPVSLGFGLVIGVIWNYALNPGGNTALLFTGAAVVLGAVVVASLGYRTYTAELMRVLLEAGRLKSKNAAISSKGVVLGVAGGLLLGSFAPLMQLARFGDNGLGPYSGGFMLALGVVFSTFVFNLFFMNLPVKGEPVDVGEYFRAPMQKHGLGLLGGIIWYVGAIATLVGNRVEGAARVQPPFVFAFSQAGIIIAAICGIVVWNEFAGADVRVKTYLGLMLILLAIGIGIVSTASLVPAY
jgi:glucose uptake protein